MTAYLLFPVAFIHFWYIEAPWILFSFYRSINSSYLQLTSVSLLVRTYFQPLKQEYRKGLVGFSIGMGVVVKGMLIAVDLLGFTILLSLEIVFTVLFLLVPVLSIVLLFR